MRPYIPSSQDREFFAKYYNLLQLEGLAGEKQQALLWQTPVKERVELGTAIRDLVPLDKPEPTGQGEWKQKFSCTNTSELRTTDEILLSDGNPMAGEVVTGTILDISSEEVTVWSPELIAHPTLIDRYDINVVHVRTLQNLLRWLQADPHLRELVSGTTLPQFDTTTNIPPRADFNAEQNLAVERAMQMQDYLLIHFNLLKQARPVLLVKSSNVSASKVSVSCLPLSPTRLSIICLNALILRAFHDFIRLGSERSVDSTIEARLLKKLVGQNLKSMDLSRSCSRLAPKRSCCGFNYRDVVFGQVCATIIQWSRRTPRKRSFPVRYCYYR